MSRMKIYFALESKRDTKATLVVSDESTIADAIEKLHQQNSKSTLIELTHDDDGVACSCSS